MEKSSKIPDKAELSKNIQNQPTSNKIIDAGYTFFSLICQNMVVIVGSLKEYLQIEAQKADKITSVSKFNFNLHKNITKIKSKENNLHCINFSASFRSNFTPIQISCSKFSLAILLKSEQKNEKIKEDLKEFSDLFEEFDACLKAKGLNFQSYFMNKLGNDILFKIGREMDVKAIEKELVSNQTSYISDAEFQEKVTDLINGEKYTVILKKMFDKFKQLGWTIQGKVDVFQLYKLMYNREDFSFTRLMVIGDFAKNWVSNWKEGELKENWKVIYDTSYVFELPFVTLPIKQVEVGENHMLMLTIDGDLFACGDGTNGATGTGIRSFHSVPAKVKFQFDGIRVSKIACGTRHSLAIDMSNMIYTWGCGQHGRLGHGNERDQFSPKLIDSLSSSKVVEIDADDTYSACVTLDGALFTWGQGDFGRLGHQENNNEVIPKKVEYLSPFVVNVKCGYYCTIVYVQRQDSSKLEIYTLGAKTTSLMTMTKTIEDDDTKPTFINDNNINGLKKIDFNIKNEFQSKKLPIFAVCGYQYIAMISQETHHKEDINKNEDLEDKSNIITQPEVPPTKSYYFCDLYISGNMSMTINKNGVNFKRLIDEDFFEIFDNKKKALENSVESLIKSLTELGSFDKRANGEAEENKKKGNEIKKVVCGDNNTAVLSTEGNLYVFGSYLYKICQDQVDNYTIPVQPKGVKIIHMTIGANHLIMVSNNYEVYGAGRNSEGQLGMGKPSDTIDIANACCIDKLRNKGVNKCYSSDNYTVCLTFNNEGYIFGDISFLEKSQFLHHQSTPKKLDWGEIFKIACGSTHILMMVRDERTGQILMKAIGNGTYGKLGDDSENEDNCYEPVNVDIQLSLADAERKNRVMLRCSRLNSACLIQDPISKENRKLYVWGLCSKALFNNPREIEKYDKKKYDFVRPFPIDNSVAISKPIQISPWSEGITKIALNDTLLYAVTNRSELRNVGMFFSALGKGHNLKNSGEFDKVALGNDHAAAISKNNKLFTWGFNVMHKLGFVNDKEKDTAGNLVNYDEVTDFNDLMGFFKNSATNVTNFNKIFESKKTVNAPAVNKLVCDTVAETAREIMEEKKKEEVHLEDPDNVFSQTHMIVKSDYDNLENILLSNELEFKKTLKSILENYSFLVKNNSDLTKLKRTLYTQFNFKMADPPIEIKLKDSNENKLPNEYIKYKRNYKCLLTTLRLHPCYIVKLYEKEYFHNNERDICPRELYRIIKRLFSNIYEDKYAQFVLIILAKKILEIDIKKLKKNCNLDSDKKNMLENYCLYKMNSAGDVEFNLFARICQLIFKAQIKQTRRQELMAMHLIGQVYAKTGGRGSTGYENAMLLKYHPSRKKKQDTSETYSHQKNQRMELIFQMFEFFCNNFKNANTDFEKLKNPLLSAGYKTAKENENEKFMKLTKMSKLLLGEITATLTKLLEVQPDSDIITHFIIEKFPSLIFRKLLKVIENPKTMLSIDAGILVDRQSFQMFMDGSIHNFYSLAFVFKFCFGIMGLGDKANELCEDEVNKLIQKKFSNSNIRQLLEIGLKQIFFEKSKTDSTFDLLMMKEFFSHSLKDKSHRINFGLRDLIRLQEVVAPNIEHMRVLNEGFDLMDLVFFNKKDYPENFIGERGGVLSRELDNDLMIQVNLKTRLLAYQTPSTLMKCVHCSILTLHEFVLANELVFYKEFKFFSKSSIHGRFMNVLKSCESLGIKNDKITECLKDKLTEKDSPIFINLYNMLTLIAVDNKKVYQVDSTEIAEPKQLFDIMLNRDITNTKLKDLCKEILKKYDKMKAHREYHQQLEHILKSIRMQVLDHTGEVNFLSHSRMDLYERIKKNFEKGYGNPDIYKNYRNVLKNSSKIVKIEKHYDNLPKSKNLMSKLTKEKKDKLLPFRDYELEMLISEKVILKVLLNNCNADQNPNDFKILIQKTHKSEFVMTLTKKIKIKKSFWACSKSSDINTKKVHSVLITNDNLKLITNKAKIKISSSEDTFVDIENFVQVDPREFIKILKELTNVGLD